VRVSILGGGGFRVPLIAAALRSAGLDMSELVLYDISPQRLTVIASVLAGLGMSGAGDGHPKDGHLGDGHPCGVVVTTDLDEALRGTDLILAALRAGGLDGRVNDERTALRLGVLGQETVGAGGLSSAARAVPLADAIARRIRDLAPGAWVITMTNPAGIVTEVMARTLGSRVLGVCDSPVGLVRRASAAAGFLPGADLAFDPSRRGEIPDGIGIDYLGINHLGWLRRLTAGDTDVLPGLLADPERLALTEEGRLFGPSVLRSLGTLPNEYLYWYYAAHEALRDVQAAGRTRGEHVRDRQREFYAAATAAIKAGDPGAPATLWAAANDERNRSYFAELRTGEKEGDRDEADVAAGGYESVAAALALALAGGPAAQLILNVPNGALVPGLDADTTIEVACEVNAAGAVPHPVSPPSAHELGLMLAVRAAERTIAQAALLPAGEAETSRRASREEARALAVRAFVLHPLVGSLDAALALADAAFPDAPRLLH
jgi:6-phospho-beta-glucosidase